MEKSDKPAAGLTLAIACGGTGGHFYPGVTVAQTFVEAGGRAVLLIGGHHQREQLAAAERFGIEALPIRVARRPAQRWKYPLLVARLLGCVWESGGLLRQLDADVVLCMGSFACLPPGLAAVSLRKPLILHEANCILGQANRLLSRWADILALNLPLRPPLATRARQERVGMPIRQALLTAAAAPVDDEGRAAWRRELGLSPDLPTLLAFGGSQGAAALNDCLAAAIAQLDGGTTRLQLIHLTGRDDNTDLAARYEALGVRAHAAARSDAMDRLYQIADLVLCRSGAATVAELALFGCPALLMPLPTAADDHQTVNAEGLVAAGGALLLPERQTSPGDLAAQLAEWLDDPQRFADMGRAARGIANKGAADHVCDLICGLAGRSTPEPHAGETP